MQSNVDKYSFYGKPPMAELLLLGLQHFIAMFIGNITPILIVAPMAGIESPVTISALVQGAMLSSALATLVQLYPISLGAKFRIGSRLPVIMGTSFGFMSVNTSVASLYGIEAIFGAQIVAGLITIPIGFLLPRIYKYFPPIVTGTVVLSIGLSLFPIAIRDIGGGAAAGEAFGSLSNIGLGVFVLVLVIFLSQYTKGIFKLAAIFIATIIGYIVAIPLGKVSMASVETAAWFSLPSILSLGISFHLDSIIAMTIMYFVTALQLIGDLSATTMGGMDREVEPMEVSGGIIGNGIGAVLSALVGGLPTATFSQNVGIVTLTKVANRLVMLSAVIALALAGFVPKIAAIITSIPRPVLGGATITVFSMISLTGIRIISKEDLSLNRNVVVIGLSLAIGGGISQVPAILAHVPPSFRIVLGSSVVVSSMLAVILNLVLPKK